MKTIVVCKTETEIDRLIKFVSKNIEYDFIYPYHKNKKVWTTGYSEGIFISYPTNKALFKLQLSFRHVK